MTTGTSVFLVTRARTAVHLTSAMQGAITEILTHLGISARTLVTEWATTYEPALQAWIVEGSLDKVTLECHRRSGSVEPIFQFPIEYRSDGSGALSHRHVALARQWTKLNRVPEGTTFQIIVSYRGVHTPQPGWGPGTLASTAGMRSVTLGTLAAGSHASASVRYYTQ